MAFQLLQCGFCGNRQERGGRKFGEVPWPEDCARQHALQYPRNRGVCGTCAKQKDMISKHAYDAGVAEGRRLLLAEQQGNQHQAVVADGKADDSDYVDDDGDLGNNAEVAAAAAAGGGGGGGGERGGS